MSIVTIRLATPGPRPTTASRRRVAAAMFTFAVGACTAIALAPAGPGGTGSVQRHAPAAVIAPGAGGMATEQATTSH